MVTAVAMAGATVFAMPTVSTSISLLSAFIPKVTRAIAIV
eukprot:CAMPEP_0184495296 /NCGR_PEP_ID=MMETSP0113_2-20130426/30892_1 /TAXON_ID=91329 /ORGANISM="Norrisiella sphaerica, Strain BC52" /LENGTH=39 /DNA_ID= /DNA_START= /DNA_END= /DNA_ORIENTATION=